MFRIAAAAKKLMQAITVAAARMLVWPVFCAKVLILAAGRRDVISVITTVFPLCLSHRVARVSLLD